MKLSSKQLRAAMMCQGKDDPRYYLNGIHIYKNKIEATNGHIAVQMTMNKSIKKDLILNIRGTIPVKSHESIFVFGKDNFVKNYDEFGILINIFVVDVIDGNYPDVDRVIPKKFKAVSEIGVKASYVGIFGKMFNCKFGVAKLQFTDKNGSMLLTPSSQNIIDEYGNPKFVVMPARID